MNEKLFDTMPPESPYWPEYDAAAEWCAKRQIKGENGNPLPTNLSVHVFNEIQNFPDEFQQRVREFGYELGMSTIQE